jgi:DNA-binding transcriptional LysR family regulator
LGQAEEALKNAQSAPRGSLKVTSSHGLGTYWLLPRLEEFVREYPELQVHLMFEDRELDLAQREADLALRMRAPVQADLIQRKLFTVHYHLCATREYLEQHGTPASFEELCQHTLIAYGERVAAEVRDVNWLLDSTQRFSGGCGRALRINNITGILHAVEAGIGVAALPDYLTSERPHLMRVLPELDGPTFDVHLVYCDALRQSKRVAAFRDFLVRAAKDWKH